jgi:hypothetical protein
MSTDDWEEADIPASDIIDPSETPQLASKPVEDYENTTEIVDTSIPPLNLITKDAVVVTGQVCHRRHADQPTSTVFQFSRDLETEEQPYTRLCHKGKSKAKEEWQPIDTGWLEDKVSLLVISNDEGGHTDVNLTPEALEEIKARVIEIGIELNTESSLLVIPFQYILPKESLPISPIDITSYRIRCRKGSAKYTITAYPA